MSRVLLLLALGACAEGGDDGPPDLVGAWDKVEERWLYAPTGSRDNTEVKPAADHETLTLGADGVFSLVQADEQVVDGPWLIDASPTTLAIDGTYNGWALVLQNDDGSTWRTWWMRHVTDTTVGFVERPSLSVVGIEHVYERP